MNDVLNMNDRELLEAIKAHPKVLCDLPPSKKTYEICLTAIRHELSPRHPPCIRLKLLYFVPQELRTHELCTEAIISNSHNLVDIPQTVLTSDMCFRAVQQCGGVLGDVPPAFRNDENVLTALLGFHHYLNKFSWDFHVAAGIEQKKRIELCTRLLTAAQKEAGKKHYKNHLCETRCRPSLQECQEFACLYYSDLTNN